MDKSPAASTDDATESIDPVSASASTGPLVDDEMLRPGTRASNYVIDGLLGTGGGGIVYLAHHRVLERPAAIKVLKSHLATSPKMTARFVREASAVHKIGHPNIVDVYEFGELDDGRPFYVMELIDGTDLRKLLTLHGRFSPLEALDLLEPVCLALAAAHDAGVIHRDLKASNVLVLERQGQRIIKLVDFGIAKLLHPEPGDAGLTTPGAVLGSLPSMSPEQILCEAIDARADIYAVGVLLYQLLTGEFPFTGKREEVARMHLDAKRPRPSEKAPVPPALDSLVVRSMDRNKERRHPSIIAFLEEFRRAVRGEPIDQALVQSRAAVAIYVETRTEEEVDDAMLDDMCDILDLCESRLRTKSYALPLQTSNALLAVKLVSGEPDERKTDCKRTQAIAESLLSQIRQRALVDPRVQVKIAIHLDAALFQESSEGLEVTGGPILEVERWATQEGTQGLYLSDAFQRSL